MYATFTKITVVCIAKNYDHLVLEVPFHYNRIFILEGGQSSQLCCYSGAFQQFNIDMLS